MFTKNMINKNLKPNSARTPAERKELARKAGKQSGVIRREKKTMREMLDYLLEKEITNNKGEKATTLEAMLTATIKKAIQGDIRAVEFIRDTTGQKPAEKQEIQHELPIIIDNLNARNRIK